MMIPYRSSTFPLLAPFQVIVIGQTGVGKTKLAQRIVHNTFLEKSTQTVRQASRHHSTDVVSLGLRTAKCDNGDLLTFQIWDEPTSSPINVNSFFFDEVDAVILMFDLQDPLSFDKLEGKMRAYLDKLGIAQLPHFDASPEELEAAAAAADAGGGGGSGGGGGGSSSALPKYPIPILVVGNKKDEKQRVNRKAVAKFAAENGCLGSFMVSARTGEGVDDGKGSVMRALRNYFQTHPKLSKEAREAQYQAGIAAAQEIIEKMKREKAEAEEKAKEERKAAKAAQGKSDENNSPGPQQPDSRSKLPTLMLPGGKVIKAANLENIVKKTQGKKVASSLLED